MCGEWELSRSWPRTVVAGGSIPVTEPASQRIFRPLVAHHARVSVLVDEFQCSEQSGVYPAPVFMIASREFRADEMLT